MKAQLFFPRAASFMPRLAIAQRCLAALMVMLLQVSAAMAGPWLNADDLRLRHDLLLLADAGLISAPLTSWPIPVDDIAHGLQEVKAESFSSEALRGAFERVQEILKRESVRNTVVPHVRLAATNEPITYRGFAELQREKIEAMAGIAWQGESVFYRLDATVVENPDDERPVRGDGSYLGTQWGNWLFSAAAVDRWWGPGWNGSLILSSNARPVPALVVQRNRSTAFETPLLNWLGPWQFIFMMGQLDGEATIPYARLMGMRLNFKPTPALEIGFSRTAQWGGEGRPDDFSTFLDVLLGRDNLGDNGITANNEPGNQLAGVDFRWAAPLFDLPYAVYGQLIGEDLASGTLLAWPSKNIGLVGLELWHSGSHGRESGRLYIEYADTAAEFYESPPLYNTAYEHHIYQSGYRYYGLCLGHSMCGDGRMTTVGYVHVAASGNMLEAVMRKDEPDRDATPARTVLEAGLTYTLVKGPNRYVVGVGLDRGWVTGADDFVDGRLGLEWRRTF